MCGEFGIHPTDQQCIDELRAERDRLRQQMRPWVIEASVTAPGRSVLAVLVGGGRELAGG